MTTIASRPDESHAALWRAVEQHRAHLAEAPTGSGRDPERTVEAVADLVAVAARGWVRDVPADDAAFRTAFEGGAAPYLVAGQICERLGLPRPQEGLDLLTQRQ